MKLLRILMVLGLACLLVSACSEKPPTTVGQSEQGSTENKPIPIAQVEESETRALSQGTAPGATEPAEIDGMLMQTEKGLAVVTGARSYVVAGKDLSDMAGKMVKVTGTVAEVDGGQVIEVMTVSPIE